MCINGWSDDCRSRLLTPTEEVDFIFGPGRLLMPHAFFTLPGQCWFTGIPSQKSNCWIQ